MDRTKKNLIEPISIADAERYNQKLIVDGVRLPDPYYQVPAEEWKSDLSFLPNVTFPDIYVYFVLRSGLYKNEEMKVYKSLDAYNYFLSGFVQELKTARLSTSTTKLVCMKANVLPSQRVGQKSQPYVSWVLCKDTGEVVTGHCSCMAG